MVNTSYTQLWHEVLVGKKFVGCQKVSPEKRWAKGNICCYIDYFALIVFYGSDLFFLQLQVSFFSDDEETTSTPKADALFIPRENPRALVIRPLKQWPGKSSAEKLKNASSPAQTNGKLIFCCYLKNKNNHFLSHFFYLNSGDYTGFASSPPLNGRSTENGNSKIISFTAI